ncbi:MAG TPA: NADPH:quinone oxidoreductase family protein [Pseudonocardiaceae bacterium]|nr:NADPH:quinone oxidoreductase family protein [Pseudonocardiaceae bacterium]
MRAIQITEFGGPEVLTPTELPDPEPADGLDVLEVSAAGINYADTHQVRDDYLSRQHLPLVPGNEVVGTRPDGTRVVAVVAGGYAAKALAHPSTSFPVPDGVDDGQALALLVQGLTAWHLLRTSAHLQPGESVVVHAAAGGVGTLAVQLAKIFGAGRVIGLASTPDKRGLAESLGADATLDPAEPELTARLVEANGGAKVDVVLEMTGGAVFDASLDALAPFGRLVVFGQASREQPAPLEPARLMRRSAAVIGFWLVHCMRRPQLLHEPMAQLLDLVERGELRPIVGGHYPLADARRAHEDLLARRTVGKLVLDL